MIMYFAQEMYSIDGDVSKIILIQKNNNNLGRFYLEFDSFYHLDLEVF